MASYRSRLPRALIAAMALMVVMLGSSLVAQANVSSSVQPAVPLAGPASSSSPCTPDNVTSQIPCLPGSTFESANGSFVKDISGAKDWSDVKGTTGYNATTDLPSGSTDNSFTQGTKEDNTLVQVATG